jgi:hypothetical protein
MKPYPHHCAASASARAADSVMISAPELPRGTADGTKDSQDSRADCDVKGTGSRATPGERHTGAERLP